MVYVQLSEKLLPPKRIKAVCKGEKGEKKWLGRHVNKVTGRTICRVIRK